MPRIFISYRRADSQDQTERIHDRLVKAFGRENVFLDVDEGYIPSGSDFETVLRGAVRQCDVLLVIIGPDWLNIRENNDPDLRRLDNPNDFVRIEVETGLQNSATLVIPVLVKDAQPLPPAELPESIRDLARIQVERIRRNPDFHKDVDGLIGLIRSHARNRRRLYVGIIAAIVTFIVIAAIVIRAVGNNPENALPTQSPEPATAAVLLITERVGQTLTSVAPTKTNTPDLTRTVDSLVTQYFVTEAAKAAETIAAYTETPTLTFTPSATPTPTEDQNATSTVQALTQIAVQQAAELRQTQEAESTNAAQQLLNSQATLNAQATANVPTDTRLPPPTSTLTPTATWTETPLPTPTPTLTTSPTVTATPTPTINLTGTANAFAAQTQVAASNATQAVLAAQGTLAAQVTPTNTAIPSANRDFFPLTAENISYGFTVYGDCPRFNFNAHLLFAGKTVYDLKSGAKLFSIFTSGTPVFSPDWALLAVSGDGVYDSKSGQKRFSISGSKYYSLVFSPDGALLAVSGDGVYDSKSGQKRFSISGDPVFSPDGALLAVSGYGVYDSKFGEKLFSISGSKYYSPVFSPDGTLLAVSGDGVYDSKSGQKRFSIFGSKYYSLVFSPDGALLAVSGYGVYDSKFGEKLFSVSGSLFGLLVFSPDGALLAVSGDGVYDSKSGQKRFSISGDPVFSPDGALLAVSGYGVYDSKFGEKFFSVSGSNYGSVGFSPDGTLVMIGSYYRCDVYGAKGNVWPIQSGVVHAVNKNIRINPDINSTVLRAGDGDLIVVGRTEDNQWYQVISEGDLGWISASVVDVVSMPDKIPVLTPQP